MALVKIGYFCSSGYTETGGMEEFLKKLLPNVRWERCFPAVSKPAPKLRRERQAEGKPMPLAEPRSSEAGLTGDVLQRRMMEILKTWHVRRADPCDAYLLIDDADCRYCAERAEVVLQQWNSWQAGLGQQVERELGRKVPVVALLASPEVEGWLVADWERSFQEHYPGLATELRRWLKGQLSGSSLESFGCPQKDGGCTRKLSEELQEEVRKLGGRFSKKDDAPHMLMRVRPDKVATSCPGLFLSGWRALQSLPPQNQPPPP
jgi:hypothetical protein